MKAIETTYNGVRFRSRTEARWAIVFDRLRIPWEYEREGFELQSGRYVPDFWLPKLLGGMWFEVKGEEPTERERLLCCELASESGHDVALSVGFTGLHWYPCRQNHANVSLFIDALDVAAKDPAGFVAAFNAATKHRFWNPHGAR